ncbi:hypothetical protein CAPTEDRAFT_123745 [Capitella teleta]|uniref:Beta-glucuronidase n=1 Tax=Capitella teleta TaxID=283909 RepID=R7U298_CAPTE|nr:hypothetical protein CAPTEDRAFT_123745 [Capitella teleta]|eukprot:ELU00445.1 hypothetical protein CAPTEDRAFT_123745 [Capitella teleta]
MQWSYVAFLLTILGGGTALESGMLFPRESESRQIRELQGMWNFRADTSFDRNAGFKDKWYEQRLEKSGPVIRMPVPSSYNDITVEQDLRDHVGWVWYERDFFVPMDWVQSKRIVLRIDSAHYYAIVFVNGRQLTEHEGGHLPFEAVVNDFVNKNVQNRVTVAVNNTLTPHTIPPGRVTIHRNSSLYPENYMVQDIPFDFFNYAGLHRKVILYATPKTYVDDITVVTNISGTYGIVKYNVSIGGNAPFSTHIAVVDQEYRTIAEANESDGELNIADARLWWPYSMRQDDFGYMYELQVTVNSSDGIDVYRLPFGIRTVKATDTQLLINEEPFYCLGFGRHEDSDIRGKGLDLPLIARDYNLLKWMGSNCYRTSHYPYAEEILDEASRWGIVIIDESPAASIREEENFNDKGLKRHLVVMEELVRRDKNKPCVIMWSIANQPKSENPKSGPYFKNVFDFIRALDPTRPLTFAIRNLNPQTEYVAQYVDILSLNRYFGWYFDTGHTEVIQIHLSNELQNWYNKFKKPIIVSEYGADAIAGMHMLPSRVFTEDFQTDFLMEYHAVFDVYRKMFLVGEMIWNFADFMTKQGVFRVGGNKKGILTRERQPKDAAYLIRYRYWSIINGTDPSGYRSARYTGA